MFFVVFGVKCLAFGVWRLVFGVSCLVFGVAPSRNGDVGVGVSVGVVVGVRCC